jgi:hypothetical protein
MESACRAHHLLQSKAESDGCYWGSVGPQMRTMMQRHFPFNVGRTATSTRTLNLVVDSIRQVSRA